MSTARSCTLCLPILTRSLAIRTDFVITTSVDGHVKLWKKQADSVEFVKHYRASLNSIVAVSADHEGKVFATVSEGGEGRVFDVVNFGKHGSDLGLTPVCLTILFNLV